MIPGGEDRFAHICEHVRVQATCPWCEPTDQTSHIDEPEWMTRIRAKRPGVQP